jgi:hypothetical protein
MRIISSIVLALAVLATTMGAPSSPAPTTDDTVVAVRPISATCPTCGPRVVGPDGVTLGR